jgi:predicted Rossmann fold nucleotide-binding protein DprA/Smf involved in DNA uptake
VAAHRGALAAGEPTVCVLAKGVDMAYPPAHAALFETLACDQLLVSELPPDLKVILDGGRRVSPLLSLATDFQRPKT